MVAEAVSIFGQALTAVVGWFLQFLSQDELSGFFLSGVFLLLLGKFLLAPLFGSAGSDKARRKKDDSDV